MKYTLIIIAFLTMACQSTPDTRKANSSSDSNSSLSYIDLNVASFKEAIKAEENIVIDVRTPAEIADGKIGNAIELDFHNKDFSSKINALDKSRNYYLYCKVGGRSAKAAQIMIENGFENVYNLEGGYDAWKKDLE